METNSAKLLSPVHQGDLQTQVGGMKSSGVTARARTYHYNLGLGCLSRRAFVFSGFRAFALHAKNLPNSFVVIRAHIDRFSIPRGHFPGLTDVV